VSFAGTAFQSPKSGSTSAGPTISDLPLQLPHGPAAAQGLQHVRIAWLHPSGFWRSGGHSGTRKVEGPRQVCSGARVMIYSFSMGLASGPDSPGPGSLTAACICFTGSLDVTRLRRRFSRDLPPGILRYALSSKTTFKDWLIS
jgi:hypothetical protein